MKKPPPPYCSPTMFAMMLNIKHGCNPGFGLRLKKGGAAGNMSALKSRGWVAGSKLSEAGEAYLISVAAE